MLVLTLLIYFFYIFFYFFSLQHPECILSYDMDKSIAHSIDLGSFPFLKKVEQSELTNDQAGDPFQLGRPNPGQFPKLISTHQQNLRRVGKPN